MIQIETVELSAGYSTPVLSGLNLTVNDGDYLCIIGSNGSGKSTLMRTLLGLLPPLSGKIFFNVGKNEIGYVPQQNELQKDFPASVMEVVISGCLGKCGFRPFYGKNEKNKALEAMKKMNISDLASMCYRELSGGQRQRVLLARSLCAAGKIIFLDEPVAGLDPDSSSEFYRVIKELNDSGVTVIMISHDTGEALKYSNRVLELGKGNKNA